MAGEDGSRVGWETLARTVAAAAVVAEAEAYAGGARRVTVEHGEPLTEAAEQLLARLVEDVDAAVWSVGQVERGTLTQRVTSLTWSLPSTDAVPARALVLAARAAADGLNPGGWVITADDYA